MKKLLAIAALALFAALAPTQAQSPSLIKSGHVWGNSTAAERNGRDETVSAILDRALGSVRGNIIERGASGWQSVGPGTTGLAWVGQGGGADPIYGIVGLNGGGCNAALTASNGGILYSTATTCAIFAGTANAGRPLLSGASTIPSWAVFSLPGSVTSGGIPYFSSTSQMTSSALLGANQVVVGGGAGTSPSTISLTSNQLVIGGTPPVGLGTLGTTTTVLHGNAGGAPTFAGVSLTADVTGQLPFASGGCAGTSQTTCFNNAAPTPARAGDLIYFNGSNWVNLAGNNSGTNVLQETSAGVPSWVAAGTGTVTSAIITASGGLNVSGTCTITTSGTCNVANSFNQQLASAYGISPTGTNNATGVMMGIGCAAPPSYSTRMLIAMTGQFTSATGSINATAGLRFGTGGSPANCAALTGTLKATKTGTIAGANFQTPFYIQAVISGLTPATNYWIDLSLSTGSGSVVSVTNVDCFLLEM